MLSVQVHPSDAHPDLIPEGDTAKTEAWVVIDAAKGSQIYAGLKSGTTAGSLKESLLDGTIADHLVSISPNPGDAVFIPGGTVHTLGDDVVVFEVQQNSDTTFRLYDWGHIDPETKKPRALQVDEALACIEFGGSNGGLISPRVETTSPVERERLFDCHAFRLWRLLGRDRFTVGAKEEPRVLVGIQRIRPAYLRWHDLHDRQGRCLALAGGGRRVPVSTERRSKRAGDRDPLIAEKSTLQQYLRIGDE